MHHIRLIASRVNTDAPFFWESEDPEIVALRQYSESKSAAMPHLYSGSNTIVVPTGLMYIVEWFFNSKADWETLQAEIIKDMPDFFTKREEYFIQNDHKLFVEIRNDQGDVIHSVTAIPNSTGIG